MAKEPDIKKLPISPNTVDTRPKVGKVAKATKTSSVANKAASKKDKQEHAKEILSFLQTSLPMMTVSINNIGTRIGKSDKILSSIHNVLKTANDQREQAANLAEERDIEAREEQAFIEEKRAEKEQQQNAEIIKKLATIDESLNGLSFGAAAGGKGIGDLLGDLLGNLGALGGGLLGSLASLAGAILTNPVFLALAAAALGGALGHMLWKTWLEPLMEKQFSDRTKAMSQTTSSTTEQSTNKEGQKLFVETGSSGETKIISEADLATRAASEGKTAEEYTQQQMDSGNLRKLTYKKDFAGNIIQGQETYSTEEQQQKAQQLMAKAVEVTEEIDRKAASEVMQNLLSGKDFTKMSEEDKKLFAAQAGADYKAITGREINPEYFNNLINDPERLKTALAITNRQLRFTAIENLKEDIGNLHTRLVSALTGTYNSEEEAALATETAKNLLVDIGKKLYPAKADETTLTSSRYKGITPDDIAAIYENYPLLDHFMRKVNGVQEKIMADSQATLIYDAQQGHIGEYGARNVDGKWVIGTVTGMWPFNAEDVPFNKLGVDSTFPASAFDSLKNIPQLAGGGIVIPKSSMGVLANISENMKPEAIVPLDKYLISEKPEAINISDKVTDIMRSAYFEEKDATQNQPPIIVNNVNNVKGGGSTEGGVNFQFQTDMTKTFDNVFDMLLEKNMRMAL